MFADIPWWAVIAMVLGTGGLICALLALDAYFSTNSTRTLVSGLLDAKIDKMLHRGKHSIYLADTLSRWPTTTKQHPF